MNVEYASEHFHYSFLLLLLISLRPVQPGHFLSHVFLHTIHIHGLHLDDLIHVVYVTNVHCYASSRAKGWYLAKLPESTSPCVLLLQVQEDEKRNVSNISHKLA